MIKAFSHFVIFQYVFRGVNYYTWEAADKVFEKTEVVHIFQHTTIRKLDLSFWKKLLDWYKKAFCNILLKLVRRLEMLRMRILS